MPLESGNLNSGNEQSDQVVKGSGYEEQTHAHNQQSIGRYGQRPSKEKVKQRLPKTKEVLRQIKTMKTM